MFIRFEVTNEKAYTAAHILKDLASNIPVRVLLSSPAATFFAFVHLSTPLYTSVHLCTPLYTSVHSFHPASANDI